ncbi:hypothetical protein [Bradyrhizobium zhanjiangense]|uniref:hypothetical protein n=1 Tax=Bradyrhizobium zhanjiangense TaxID=1325107 RepID=UPI0030B848EC
MTEVADIPLQTIVLKLKKIAPALMPPTAEDRLRDILEAIVEIEALLAGYNLDLFTADKTENGRFRQPLAPRVPCNRRRNCVRHRSRSPSAVEIFR